ncbi:uncharacterized protein Dana_GF20327 [Drosophila ananassae]|uniref:Uncharacterized protein n=1 Tax=Drosophila ananassae TaxID=7217 RepID=B3MQ15_DROAN|nr:gastrula zinc finger protein XlCGF26.1 [Drosophila ananassae]EDV44441.2 uncharacterized protein Dana_GF20327 [Drosophila ananassae]
MLGNLSRKTAPKHCRTCLVKLDKSELKEQDLMEIPISQELEKLLNIDNCMDKTPDKLQEEHWWPRTLCAQCQDTVQSFEKFRRKAEDSRQQLLELLKEESEPEDEASGPEEDTPDQEPNFEVVYDHLETNPHNEQDSLQSSEPPEPPDPDPKPDPIAKKEEKSPSRRTRNSLKCSLCRHSFANQLTLSAHVRKVHEGSKRPFQCDKCEKAYSFMGGLYTHIREVHAPLERRHPCDQPGCERVYTSRVAMQKHKRLKHNPRARDLARKFICEQCGASFNQSANLKYHRRTKHPTEDEVAAKEGGSGERYFCEPCQKEFHSRYTLKYHTLQQHSAGDAGQEAILPHECQVCGRRMAKKFMLLQHMLMHSSEKLPCEHCGRQFARRFELEAHVRAVHLKLKPFTCRHCPESFASRKTLRHHEYIHTGEKPYVCDTCGQAFRQQTCLKNHRKVHEK